MRKSVLQFPLIFQRKLAVNILKFTGVGAACFVFEACYGVPSADFPSSPGKNTDISGVVKTADGTPVPNAEVLFTRGRYGDTLKTFANAEGYYILDDVKGDFKTCYLEAHGQKGASGSEVVTMKTDPKASNNLHIDLVVKSE